MTRFEENMNCLRPLNYWRVEVLKKQEREPEHTLVRQVNADKNESNDDDSDDDDDTAISWRWWWHGSSAGCSDTNGPVQDFPTTVPGKGKCQRSCLWTNQHLLDALKYSPYCKQLFLSIPCFCQGLCQGQLLVNFTAEVT